MTNIEIDDYAGVILPCMAADLGTPSPKEAIDIIKKAVEQGKPVAAQTTGLWYLEDAGVLKGKRFASTDDMAYYFADAIHHDPVSFRMGISSLLGFVQTWRRTLAGLKDGTSELTQRFIDALKSSH